MMPQLSWRKGKYDVVLKMLADTREIELDIDACSLQHIRGANTTVK